MSPLLPRRRALPRRAASHLHRCGDYDNCHEEEPLLTDCAACRREAAKQGGADEPASDAATA